jgi:STAS-like domain of unknown function (DUF4325)
VNVVLEAKEFLDPQGLIVESASLLSKAVISHLAQGQDVTISLSQVRGISSSYFNIILGDVVAGFGADVIGRRVIFQFDSEPQRQVFQRSLDSLTKPVA